MIDLIVCLCLKPNIKTKTKPKTSQIGIPKNDSSYREIQVKMGLEIKNR